MLETNEYFNGRVKSIKLNTSQGPATVGVMAKGEYEFSTSSKEIMVVTSGKLKVKLPGRDTFDTVVQNESFNVDANVVFNVIVEEDSSYICYYK